MPSPLWRLLNPVTGRHFQGSLLGVGRGGFEDGLFVHCTTTPGPLWEVRSKWISMALSGEGVLSNYDWPDFISLEIKFVASYWVD